MHVARPFLPLSIHHQPSEPFFNLILKPCTHFPQRLKDQLQTKSNKMKLEVEKIAVPD